MPDSQATKSKKKTTHTQHTAQPEVDETKIRLTVTFDGKPYDFAFPMKSSFDLSMFLSLSEQGAVQTFEKAWNIFRDGFKKDDRNAVYNHLLLVPMAITELIAAVSKQTQKQSLRHEVTITDAIKK